MRWRQQNIKPSVGSSERGTLCDRTGHRPAKPPGAASPPLTCCGEERRLPRQASAKAFGLWRRRQMEAEASPPPRDDGGAGQDGPLPGLGATGGFGSFA